MKKITSFVELYEFNTKLIKIYMPIIAVGLIIAAIVVTILFPGFGWWVGLIFLGMATYIAIACFFIVKYRNKKLKEFIENETSEKAHE